MLYEVITDKCLNKSFKQDIKGRVLPVLYPFGQGKPFYELVDGQLVFYHDLLKSSFYLLSAYQELHNKQPDPMGRFQFQHSIQSELGFVTTPLVNYYFEVLVDGLEAYCNYHHLSFKRKRLFDTYGFMLTHDVDRVQYYHWRETALKWMQLFGLKKSTQSKVLQLKTALASVVPTLLPKLFNDKWWNFKALRTVESNLGLRSVWYFLNQDGSPHDAKYTWDEPRIQQLIKYLESESCEIGLHGSIKTALNQNSMLEAKAKLESLTAHPVVGTRQHFLKMTVPNTLGIQQQVGLLYDSTMGFAEHEGFRTSYCYPYHPYDHMNDCMLDIWEFPLAIMDTTYLGYRHLNYTQMTQATQVLVDEVHQFGGLLVVLWHNCNIEDAQYPGITAYYETFLGHLVNSKPSSITGAELLDRL